MKSHRLNPRVVGLLLLALFLLVATAGSCAEKEVAAGKGGGTKVAKEDASEQDDSSGADENEDEDASQGIEEQLRELKQQVEKLRKEAEARKRLEVSEEEKQKKAEDILTAAGREYTLLRKGMLSVEYSFNYAYFSGDVIKNAATVEKRVNHNITNLIYTEYGLRDNLSVNLSVPFIYKYNNVGTSDSQEASDLGDVSLGLQYQPVQAGADMPAVILSAGATFPFGTSPYKIDPNTSLATGSGFYAFSGGVTLSKTMDPLVAFGNLTYTYSLPAEKLDQKWSDGSTLKNVDPGSTITTAMGFGYALSYKVSLNISAAFNYNFSTDYWTDKGLKQSGSSMGGTLNIGTGWRVTPERTISVKVGVGLTSNDPDFTFSVRIPFEF